MRSANTIGAHLIAQVCDGLWSLRWLTAMQLLIVGTGMSFAQGRVGINTAGTLVDTAFQFVVYKQ